MYYSKKYKYKFLTNSLLFSSSIKRDAKVIFITTNGLKDILINGKMLFKMLKVKKTIRNPKIKQ